MGENIYVDGGPDRHTYDDMEVEDGVTGVTGGQGTSNPVIVELDDPIFDVDDDNQHVKNGNEKRGLPPKGKSPKKMKESKERYVSPVWDHFDRVEEGGIKWAVCKYCPKRYMADGKKHGITNLKHHTPVCRGYPNRDQDGQTNISFKPKADGGVEVVSSIFSQEECKKGLAEMIIIDELSFRFVEGVGFRRFCKIMQPKFSPVSRQTISREVSVIHKIEKLKLKKVLKGRRICLTTDTWTSIQNFNYMCLTSHFIDDDWKLQKKILNFCLVEDHKGVTLGKKIESLLLEWKVEGIFTMTVDNASSNNKTIDYLARKTKQWKRTILNHEYLHVRCCAHVLNLIVVEGLKEQHESIARVRDVVRYVRSSPQRLESLKKCAVKENIKSNQTVCLDVSTRWNSTYLMLEVAVKFQEAFERMGEDDTNFIKYFGIEGDGGDSLALEGEENLLGDSAREGGRKQAIPTKQDWRNCRMFVQFLKLFYDATKKFSGSLFVTSNSFFEVMVRIESNIDELIESSDYLLSSMAFKMKEKYDKYWGDGGKMNVFLYVAAALDPRFKLKYLKFLYTQSKGSDMGLAMEARVKEVLHKLYDAYANEGEVRGGVGIPIAMPRAMVEVNDKGDKFDKLNMAFDTYLEEEHSSTCSLEVDKYLVDMCVRRGDDSFDILAWWRANSTKYPILSRVARDILAMPVSTVASESAFSTGGRILDPFRSSLSPTMVETLVCTQNWLLSTVPISIRQSLDKVEEYERDMLSSDGSGVTSDGSGVTSETLID